MNISRIEGDASVDSTATSLQISDDKGKMVVSWKGVKPVKGFIIHRAEKGNEHYTPVSGLIPYFGHDGKEQYLYKFTDNSATSGIKYEYRLETIEPQKEAGFKITLTD